MDPTSFASMKASTGDVGWSRHPVPGIAPDDLDLLEIARPFLSMLFVKWCQCCNIWDYINQGVSNELI